MRALLALFSVCFIVSACAGPDCPAICQRTLACDVTFTPADDPNLERVSVGERSAQESCELGCQESLGVDDHTEACVAAVKPGVPAECRPDILACLGSS